VGNGKGASWVQTDDTVTITVPLPEDAPAGLKPEVTIRPQHLVVRCPLLSRPPLPPSDALLGGDRDSSEVILLDSDLSGDVSLEDSTWTVSDGVLVIDLAKKPDFSIPAGGAGRSSEHSAPRPPWWPCAVRGGTPGPPDPKAVAKPGPTMHRLDAKIGEQSVSKKGFDGKSKFQW
ncbi:unnamed protein product, partial [Polarella glacialis]